MALRVLLVGLVASLGFELPSGPDLESWAGSGRAWFDARMADLGGFRLDAGESGACVIDVCEGSPPSTTELASSRADLIFEAAVERMAAEFAADLASMEPAKSVSVEEAVEVVGRSEEMPPASPTGPSIDAEGPSSPSPVAIPSVEAGSMAAKLSVAVRLTREAVDAWASLIQSVPVEVAGDGRDDSF